MSYQTHSYPSESAITKTTLLQAAAASAFFGVALFFGVAFFAAGFAAFFACGFEGLAGPLVTRPDFVLPRIFFSSTTAGAGAAVFLVVRLAPVLDLGFAALDAGLALVVVVDFFAAAGLAFVVVVFLGAAAFLVLGAADLVLVVSFFAAGFFSVGLAAGSFFASLTVPDVPETCVSLDKH